MLRSTIWRLWRGFPRWDSPVLVLCGGGTSTLARSGGELIDFLPAEDLLSLSRSGGAGLSSRRKSQNRHRAHQVGDVKLRFPSFKELILVSGRRSPKD